MLDNKLHLVIWKWWGEILLIVLDYSVFPRGGRKLFKIDANIEETIVSSTFWEPLATEGLKTRGTIFNRRFRNLRWFWDNKRRRLRERLVESIKLLERSRRAVCIERISCPIITGEVGKVQEIARVSAVHENFCLLGEYLAPGFSEERGASFQVLLHISCRNRFCGEQKAVSAARFTAADNQWELQGCYFFNQRSMVDRVLVNIDTAPDASVISTNRDNAKGRLNTNKVTLPKVIRRRFAYNRSLPVLFSITPLPFDDVRAIGDIQSTEYCLEFCYIGHSLSL